MAREPLTTKTWSSYDRSSWQSEPSKESRWRDWRRTSLRKFVKGTRGDQEEPVAKAAKELQQAASKTVCSTEWSEEEGLLQFRGKIYVPWNADL